MYIVQESTPRKQLKGGDLVVIDNNPYFVIEYPIIALLDATHCHGLAEGKYESLEELNNCLYSRNKNIQVFTKEEYHFKIERREK